MDLKSFLRPTHEKILISLLLIGITVLIHLAPVLTVNFFPISALLLLASFPFYLGAQLFLTSPFFYLIAIYLLVAYPFTCYLIQKKRRWINGLFDKVVLYLVVYIISTIVIISVINVYNGAVGHSCINDTDCHFVCGGGYSNGGNINRQYLLLNEPFAIVDCVYRQPICENNKCDSFALYRVNSSEYCERITNELQKEHCYDYLAKNLNNPSFCNKITNEYNKNYCLDQFK